MQTFTKTKNFIIVTAVLAVFMTACGDDPVSVKEDPPALPPLEVAIPDVSFFENQPNAKIEFNNYYQAQMNALILGIYSSIFQLYSGMFYDVDSDQADFKNGEWIWEYSYNYDGASMSMKLTAEVKSESTIWKMTYSLNDGETAIRDYTIIEGTVANDGKSGTWQFNSLNTDTNEEVPLIKSNFTSNDDGTKQNVETIIYDESEILGTIDFEKDAPEYFMTMDGTEFDNISIFWNDQTNFGYLQDADGKKCWDSEFQDIACSVIGL